eukprot:m.278819 g.278819  ORF g.278819 m.278819 type:complete len:313 (-) comp11102_c2_seq2:1397-2335(-)
MHRSLHSWSSWTWTHGLQKLKQADSRALFLTVCVVQDERFSGSESAQSTMSAAFSVHLVPVLSDNYAYLIVDEDSQSAAIVDGVNPDKVLEAARGLGVTVTTVLTTHRHSDHSGGNRGLADALPGVPILGGKGDSAPGATREVGEDDVIELGKIKITVLETPCHTPGHVCYVVHDGNGPQAVFTGDTLFVAGCGNFNDGTPQQMYTALVEKIGALPGHVKVYVGHEYTVSNLEFALTVEPDSEALKARYEWAQTARRDGKPTVPSTVADEWATNPFMRVREPSVQVYAGVSDPVEAIAIVRQRKSAGAWKKK